MAIIVLYVGERRLLPIPLTNANTINKLYWLINGKHRKLIADRNRPIKIMIFLLILSIKGAAIKLMNSDVIANVETMNPISKPL